jgi:cobalt-zinc-cadmium efflux system protein
MTGHHHGPGGHTTAAVGSRNSRYLAGALALILVFMAVEVVVGIIASSLALISDAGHMLTDAAAIALALIAARLGRRWPPASFWVRR